jgi:hypothetical protein
VAYLGGVGVHPLPKNSEVLTKPSQIPWFRGKYIRKNLIRIRGSLVCKLSETPATAPRPPFSLPSVLNWICWTPPPPRTKFLGTPLGLCSRQALRCPYEVRNSVIHRESKHTAYLVTHLRRYIHCMYTARSYAFFCDRPLAAITGSIPQWAMNVCLLWVLCVAR